MRLKTTTYIFLVTTVWTFCWGQNSIKTGFLKDTELPADLKYVGKLKSAIKFSDKSGQHLVILTETGQTPSKNAISEDYRDSQLFALHFMTTGQTLEQTWKIYDFIKECPVDIETEFLSPSPTVTDLDGDGIAEIWVIYKTVCHGDVSPSTMKLIMYEDRQKFAMRGRNKVEFAPRQFEGGEYIFDQAFKSAPTAFREFALDMWTKNVNQTWK